MLLYIFLFFLPIPIPYPLSLRHCTYEDLFLQVFVCHISGCSIVLCACTLYYTYVLVIGNQ